MGILRADRITGLGGANAITGSVFFAHDGSIDVGARSGALQVENKNDALTFGTGDWTVEFWFYANRVGVVQHLYDGRGTGAGSNTAVLIRLSDANKIQFFTTNAFRITGSTTIIKNAWYHVALTRTGSTHTLYVNGSSDGTYSNSGMDYTGPTNGFAVIGSDDNRDGRYGLNGHVSNLRVAKELIYSAAFSVPTTALAPTSNTTLLCCQSPGSVHASFGDPTLSAYPSDINSKGPIASRFTPNTPVGFSTTTDVGSQYGSTFDGFGSFATSTYMVPPGGNTRERNRGRGVYMLGYSGTPAAGNNDRIDYINIQSQGNSIRFGSLTANRYTLGAGANSTRCLFTGGYVEGNSPDTDVNIIEFVTIASEGDATDFGDRTQVGRLPACASNDTRCVMASAKTGAGNQDTIDFVTIATTGNATGFGDLTSARTSMCMSCNSTTRGIFSGGYQPSPVNAAINTIEFITFATTGNGTNFGDLTSAAQNSSGGTASSSTRGLIGLGFVSPARVNTIDFVTIASTGDASDFGDLTLVRQAYGSVSNSTRGVFLGGSDPYTNTIDFVTIASTGDASDFGDVSVTQSGNGAAGSDSHGGLS